jgi:hypothetical protein
LSRLFQAIGREELLCHGFSKQLDARNCFVTAFPRNWTRGNALSRLFQVVGRAELPCHDVSRELDSRNALDTPFGVLIPRYSFQNPSKAQAFENKRKPRRLGLAAPRFMQARVRFALYKQRRHEATGSGLEVWAQRKRTGPQDPVDRRFEQWSPDGRRTDSDLHYCAPGNEHCSNECAAP